MHYFSRWLRRGGTVLTLIGTVAALTLTACGTSGPAQSAGGAGGTLQVWVYQDASTTVQQSTVDEFNKTSPVKVVLTQIPGDDYPNKLRIGMGSSNQPDVFFNWGGGSIKPYADAGKLLDLTPTLTADPQLKQAFLPSILDDGKIGDKYYGIPMRGMQPVVLFYNKTVFDQVGAQPPKSWQDVLNLITTFKNKGITPFALAGATAWTEQMWLEYLVDRIAGPAVFAKIAGGDASQWGNPAILSAATTVKTLVDSGAFGSNYGSVSYTTDGASTLFAKGRAAMHLMGSWEYSNQLSAEPKFAADGLGWTAFPSIPGGAGDPADVVGNPTNYWSINSATKNKDAAIAFVKLAAQQDYAAKLVKNGDVPTTSNAKSLLATSPNPVFSGFQFDLVSKAPSFTLSWDQALPPQEATPMTTNIQKLFAGQVTPQQFVDAMKILR
jgi:xylobiose transport system substrate-binding protein